MRVFITGASGWIGSAVVTELIGAGHEAVGLARSDTAADALVAAGAQVRRGTIDDLDLLRAAAAEADGVIHLAFKHDIAFSGGFEQAAEADRRAIETLAAGIEGSGRALVIASGVLGLKIGELSTERDGHGPAPAWVPAGPRLRRENAEYALSLAERGVRSSVVRLAPTVHGAGDHGFMATLVDIARAKGLSGYIGDGENRWPAVHRADAAHLFRLAVESAPAGSTLHGVAEEGVRIRDVAEVIGRHLDVPVVSVSAEDAPAHFTWLAGFLGADSPSANALTRELLDWQPTQPGLLADLDKGHYFVK